MVNAHQHVTTGSAVECGHNGEILSKLRPLARRPRQPLSTRSRGQRSTPCQVYKVNSIKVGIYCTQTDYGRVFTGVSNTDKYLLPQQVVL